MFRILVAFLNEMMNKISAITTSSNKSPRLARARRVAMTTTFVLRALARGETMVPSYARSYSQGLICASEAVNALPLLPRVDFLRQTYR